MQTDWVLIRRLGRELDGQLRNARVVDAGMLARGCIGALFRSHGHVRLVTFDLFGSPPLVMLADGEAPLRPEPGFARTLQSSLRGMRLESVAARRGDRLLRFTFGARSRFGVGTTLDLYCELVPRFGNLVLVKGERVVAAWHEFSLAQNARRIVQAGQPYELPPLPARPRTLAPTGPDVAHLDDGALYVYRTGGVLQQAYVVPLPGFETAELSRDTSLLDMFAEDRHRRDAQSERGDRDRRRVASLKLLDRRERRLLDELEALAAAGANAAERIELRASGERIFGELHELDVGERDAAKERAQALFARYKKLSKSLPHLQARERAVRSMLEATEMLRWELERAGDEELVDVERAIAALERAPEQVPSAQTQRRRRRAHLEFRTPLGSRILVGRSPIENAELTFHVARPRDWWFHARGVPGAHVILARDGRDEPPSEEIEAAAALAAFYSKARDSGTVAVDYALRKHVRRQRNAPPGLVWYEHAQTISAVPKKLV